MRCCVWRVLVRNPIAKDTVAQPAAVPSLHLLCWHTGKMVTSKIFIITFREEHRRPLMGLVRLLCSHSFDNKHIICMQTEEKVKTMRSGWVKHVLADAAENEILDRNTVPNVHLYCTCFKDEKTVHLTRDGCVWDAALSNKDTLFKGNKLIWSSN